MDESTIGIGEVERPVRHRDDGPGVAGCGSGRGDALQILTRRAGGKTDDASCGRYLVGPGQTTDDISPTVCNEDVSAGLHCHVDWIHIVLSAHRVDRWRWCPACRYAIPRNGRDATVGSHEPHTIVVVVSDVQLAIRAQ